MKSFKEFLSESVNIAGDFNGNLYIGDSESQPEPVGESFFADIVWEGKIYRMEVEGSMMSKTELAEELQSKYPGAIVHNIYPSTNQVSRVKNVQRYQPEKLTWSE